MIAGSYKKHTNGGVLIRNMTSLADEVNINTDGTFPMVAQFAGGPETNNKADGMINALSLFRIIDYRTTDGLHDNCGWDLRTFADLTAPNQCRSWGNPFSEIYYQAINYFSKEELLAFTMTITQQILSLDCHNPRLTVIP